MRAETDNAAGSTAAAKTPTRQELQRPVDLASMSLEERVRAYRSRAFSPHELSVAVAWFADEMPMLNGEFEWIAIDLE